MSKKNISLPSYRIWVRGGRHPDSQAVPLRQCFGEAPQEMLAFLCSVNQDHLWRSWFLQQFRESTHKANLMATRSFHSTYVAASQDVWRWAAIPWQQSRISFTIGCAGRGNRKCFYSRGVSNSVTAFFSQSQNSYVKSHSCSRYN